MHDVVEQRLDDHGDPVHPYADRGDLPIGLSLEELAARTSVDKSVASRRVGQAKDRGPVG